MFRILFGCLENKKKRKKYINNVHLKQVNVDEKQRVVVVFLSEIVNDELQCLIINETNIEKKERIIILEYYDMNGYDR